MQSPDEPRRADNDRFQVVADEKRHGAANQEGRVGFQARILLLICRLFSMPDMESQPLYRFGEEPGN